MNRTRLAAGLLAAACLSSIPLAAVAAPDDPSVVGTGSATAPADQHGLPEVRSHGVDGGPKHEWPFCRGPIPRALEARSEMLDGGPKHEWPFIICTPRLSRL